MAVAANIGIGGIGFEVATPLSNKWNLRAGASFLAGSYTFTVSNLSSVSNGLASSPNGISVDAKPHFRSVSTSVDWYPWYGSFRISPGLTLYNGNRGTALATVKGGQVLSVGDGDYTSDPTNPLLATVNVRLGRAFAPRLTVGWGNMLPRDGSHFSFPFEIGVEYVGRPALTLLLTGNECDSQGECGSVADDPSTAANILSEQKDLNNDLAPLRFFPIVSTGVSYRF